MCMHGHVCRHVHIHMHRQLSRHVYRQKCMGSHQCLAHVYQCTEELVAGILLPPSNVCLHTCPHTCLYTCTCTDKFGAFWFREPLTDTVWFSILSTTCAVSLLLYDECVSPQAPSSYTCRFTSRYRRPSHMSTPPGYVPCRHTCLYTCLFTWPGTSRIPCLCIC